MRVTSRVFVTADLHLGHVKLQQIRGIDDDELVRRWNETVRKRDVVYVLGDVFRLDRVPELHGVKKLALGNHDTYPAARYLQDFSQLRACFEWDNCLLTHIPVHSGQQGRYRLNVHGHTHANTIVGPFYRCVSLEQTDYRPVSLRDVVTQPFKVKPTPWR